MKMRAKLETEGVPTPRGDVILPGAIRMDKEFIPVATDYDYGNIVGKASNLTREGDDVYVDVEMIPEATEMSYFTGYTLHDVEREENHIRKASLAAVSVSMRLNIGKVEL